MDVSLSIVLSTSQLSSSSKGICAGFDTESSTTSAIRKRPKNSLLTLSLLLSCLCAISRVSRMNLIQYSLGLFHGTFVMLVGAQTKAVFTLFGAVRLP
jgi:hypothetical protein